MTPALLDLVRSGQLWTGALHVPRVHDGCAANLSRWLDELGYAGAVYRDGPHGATYAPDEQTIRAATWLGIGAAPLDGCHACRERALTRIVYELIQVSDALVYLGDDGLIRVRIASCLCPLIDPSDRPCLVCQVTT